MNRGQTLKPESRASRDVFNAIKARLRAAFLAVERIQPGSHSAWLGMLSTWNAILVVMDVHTRTAPEGAWAELVEDKRDLEFQAALRRWGERR